MAERPHILFLMTDEHRADVAGFAGNPVIRTPVLDELARTGVVFDSAYTPSPICVPGRQCLASGQFPVHCGCFSYGDDLPSGHMTFARRFSQAGYATVACGKLHHHGPDQMMGWMQRIGAEQECYARHIEGMETDDPYRQWHSHLPLAEYIRRAGVGRTWYTQEWDEYALDGALRFVDFFHHCRGWSEPDRDRPLLLKLSFNRPHYPYLTRERELFDYYHERVPVYEGALEIDHPRLRAPDHLVLGRDYSRDEARNATAAYYGMVEECDRDFGRLLDALRAEGHDLDDWIIVFTADHGDLLGEHAAWTKRRFYEGSARVPLVIRWPKRFAPRRVPANVNTLDLFATLCELVGLGVPAGLDSRSLVPLMAGEEAGWDDESCSFLNRDQVMIKRGSLKYQWYGTGQPELLFDLGRDPGETRDVAADPAYADAIGAFRRRLAELGYPLETGTA